MVLVKVDNEGNNFLLSLPVQIILLLETGLLKCLLTLLTIVVYLWQDLILSKHDGWSKNEDLFVSIETRTDTGSTRILLDRESFSLQNTAFLYNYHHWLCIFTSDGQQPTYHTHEAIPLILLFSHLRDRCQQMLNIPIQKPSSFFCLVTDNDWVAVWWNGIWHESRSVSSNYFHAEKLHLFIDTGWIVDMSTARQWVINAFQDI